MDTERIDQELFGYLSGNLTEEEIGRVEAWIEADEKNKCYFRQFRYDFLRMRWGVRARMVSGSFEEVRKRIHSRRVFGRLRKIAAVAVLLLCAGGGLFFYFNSFQSGQSVSPANEIIMPGKLQAVLELSSGEKVRVDSGMFEVKEQNGVSICVASGGTLNYAATGTTGSSELLYNRIVTPRGGEFMLKLEDGTRVWLNASTELRYPVAFSGDHRKVYLKGEAYFEVTKDSLRPFIVMADDVHVKVYGTAFNVNNYTKDRVEAVLVSGVVAIGNEQQEQMMAPGQKGACLSGNITITDVDISSYVAWKRGDFVFVDERLESIMQKLSRWYDVDVFYNRNAAREVRLSGDMKRYENVQSLLYYFERISDVRFSIKGRTIVVE